MNAWITLPSVSADLGEGLHWDSARACLWMTDIHGRRLCQGRAGATAWRSWALLQRVGWVIPCASGDALLLGLQGGFARVQWPLVEGATDLDFE